MTKRIQFMAQLMEWMKGSTEAHGTANAFHVIAEGAGIPEGTVRKLYYAKKPNPKLDTVQALFDYYHRLSP